MLSNGFGYGALGVFGCCCAKLVAGCCGCGMLKIEADGCGTVCPKRLRWGWDGVPPNGVGADWLGAGCCDCTELNMLAVGGFA